MLMQSGDRWHCTNPSCNCELLVSRTNEIRTEAVRCACGGVMKRHYTAPVFRYLDFIEQRETQPQSTRAERMLEHLRKP